MAKKAEKPKAIEIVVPIPNSDAECDDRIAQLGDTTRAIERLTADMNESLATVKSDFESKAAPLVATVTGLERAIENYCTAQRERLTGAGKVKFYRFGNGEVMWRRRAAKVIARNRKAVLAWLIEAGGQYKKFIRYKHEIDRATMRKHPDLAKEVPGVSVRSAGEDFTITPFGAELEQPK